MTTKWKSSSPVFQFQKFFFFCRICSKRQNFRWSWRFQCLIWLKSHFLFCVFSANPAIKIELAENKNFTYLRNRWVSQTILIFEIPAIRNVTPPTPFYKKLSLFKLKKNAFTYITTTFSCPGISSQWPYHFFCLKSSGCSGIQWETVKCHSNFLSLTVQTMSVYENWTNWKQITCSSSKIKPI